MVNNVRAKPAKDNEADKEVCSKRWDMAQALEEFLSFVVLTIFLMFVCYGAQDPSRFQLTNSTISTLGDFNEVIKGSQGVGKSFLYTLEPRYNEVLI